MKIYEKMCYCISEAKSGYSQMSRKEARVTAEDLSLPAGAPGLTSSKLSPRNKFFFLPKLQNSDIPLRDSRRGASRPKFESGACDTGH